MQRKKRYAPFFTGAQKRLLTACLCTALLMSSCGIFGSQSDKEEVKEISLPVYRVDTGTAFIAKEFLGTIEGKVNVEIRPQVEGLLDQIYVDEGDFVQKGQDLFKVNPQSYQELLNNAEANENVEEAKLENAKIELERIRPLVENEVISPVRLKKAESDYDIAKASLAQATAAVASAKINMNFTTIKAPVSGYIGRIPKRIGNLVSSKDKEPITVLTDVHEVYVYFSMSESDFLHFSKAKKEEARKQLSAGDTGHLSSFKPSVTLTLADGTSYPHEGLVDAVAGQVNRNTGAISLRATFPNEENILRAGNTGTLNMTETKRGEMLIPQEATLTLQDKTFVMKLDTAGKTVRQLITIGGSAGNKYIISSGLKKGDVIITEGFDKISEGMKINPVFPQVPAASAKASVQTPFNPKSRPDGI
ncbi:efflux RND transporter periplasmic adaptor subunit [Arachidicoccus terrestris]|uniref:efflux RND transporter periplasmic adaptor subunit n=1 Tax=Arachidicoccus terrestris TaxID=2875539 RepID=UPI001CC3917F|nr:efflux RND transporter periplasmic adaptor subunit [Arachidicoccus terrestris]UAY53865.1 efflux RND transporter periplasmic adaptor subunit [Arachidicoccus terrestris]